MFSAENLTQMFTQLIPLLGHAGFQVEDVRSGWIRTRMPLEPNHNHLGSVYAGSLMSMAEISGGVLVSTVLDTSLYKLMVKNISIEYHRLAFSDVFVEMAIPEDFLPSVEAQCREQGKAFYVLTVDVMDAEGSKVATALLNYRLKPMS